MYLSVRPNQQPAARTSRSWLLTFLGFTTFGFLNFEYRYLDNLARGLRHTFAMRLFEEMTGAYVGLLLFPLVVWAIRRARIRRACVTAGAVFREDRRAVRCLRGR